MVVCHIGWQLYQQHPTSSVEQVETMTDAPNPGFWCIEPRTMGEAARGLDGDTKVFGNPTTPTQECAIGGPMIIRTVDFDGWKVFYIVGEPIALRRTLRVEYAVPVIIAPARCADMDRHT